MTFFSLWGKRTEKSFDHTDCFFFFWGGGGGESGVIVPRQWLSDTCETVAIGESHWVDFLLKARDC